MTWFDEDVPVVMSSVSRCVIVELQRRHRDVYFFVFLFVAADAVTNTLLRRIRIKRKLKK